MLPSDGPTIPNTVVTAAQGRVLIAGRLNEGIRVFYDGTYRGLIVSDPLDNASSETSSLMFRLIKDWIKECENYHQDDVSTLAPRYKHLVDIILIDVLDQKLVRALSSWRFLTISYVWGKAALETTTTANRRAREQTCLTLLRLSKPRSRDIEISRPDIVIEDVVTPLLKEDLLDGDDPNVLDETEKETKVRFLRDIGRTV
ncbi:hypothetical protein G7Y89_g10629 [Cudoniella acicularis]|uniref:Uncharacterized protein n=1 Tax=Cudoniella acicularis TaxID=354080 RepID=A0A8H4W0R9_9HELO|nr:hypothetical protein G7Y89_g10629 [Cudoniella acicularis]